MTKAVTSPTGVICSSCRAEITHQFYYSADRSKRIERDLCACRCSVAVFDLDTPPLFPGYEAMLQRIEKRRAERHAALALAGIQVVFNPELDAYVWQSANKASAQAH